MTKRVMAGARASAATAVAAPGVILMAASTIESLRAKQQELQAANEELVASADTEERDLDESELGKIKANKAEIEKLAKQIEAREAIAPIGAGRRTTPEPTNIVPAGSAGRVVPVASRNPRGGFLHFGEFAQCVRRSCFGDTNATQRLMNATASTISTEGTGADGGL